MESNVYFFGMAISVALNVLVTSEAVGQIAPDGTVNTQVEKGDNTFTITGGTQVGGNLFHSYSEFSIPTDGVANFVHSSNVGNIINRVTGRAISNIDGTIKASGTANFFLLNPNGIIFGPNARIDIKGSFLATTASSLKFTDGSEFSASDTSKESLLTVNVPMGLQFGTNPGAIVNRSTSSILNPNEFLLGLQVAPSQTLALIGGDIRQEGGNLFAPGGRIELGSVAGNSFVMLTPIEQGWQLNYEGVNTFRDIQLSRVASIDASGDGGTIDIQGRRVTLAERSQIALIPIGEQSTGNLSINASESVELFGLKQLAEGSQTGFLIQTLGSTNSGNLIVNTQRLTVRDGAIISAGSAGPGQSGDLIINASKLVEITGTDLTSPSMVSSGTTGSARGGDIIINTERLVVSDGAAVFTPTFGQGKSGNVNIQASNSVEVTGTAIVQVPENEGGGENRIPSLISTSAGFRDLNAIAEGDGGNISITTGQLAVNDGAEISVDSFQSGAAGNLTIVARSLFLDNQGKLNAVSETQLGNGGNISLQASAFIELRNNSEITATAGIDGGGGNGGNINIDTQFIFAVPSENSDITANASAGNGGSVNIIADGIFGIQFREERTRLSDITVSSEFGQSGVFMLNRPDVDPQSGLVNLPTDTVDTDNLVVQGCGASGQLTAGEFTITGRGGLPLDYNQIVELDRGLPDFGSPSLSVDNSQLPTVTSQATDLSSEPIIEAQGWVIDEQGQVVLTVQVPKATPQRSGIKSTSCH